MPYEQGKMYDVSEYRTIGRTLPDVCGELETGYGSMGVQLARTLAYAVLTYFGRTLDLYMPRSKDLHDALLKVHDGERSSIAFSGNLNGYAGQLVIRWDGEKWSHSWNT